VSVGVPHDRGARQFYRVGWRLSKIALGLQKTPYLCQKTQTLKHMPQFDSLPEAFEWFLENIYPNLPPEQKITLRSVKHAFYSEDRRVSEKRMRRALEENVTYKVRHEIELNPE
jgi:hypothetical protein